jgi:hypothetical protein
MELFNQQTVRVFEHPGELPQDCLKWVVYLCWADLESSRPWNLG